MSIFNWFRKSTQGRVDSSDLPVIRAPRPDGRFTDHLWVKLVDLPGYREWAADYDRLERIIPDLENYHLHVLPEDIKNPPAGFFERVFQGNLDAVCEHFAHLNLPRHRVEDYNRGGKFWGNNA